MRALKILGIALAGLVALIAIVVLAVWLFVNPNDYRGRIAQTVRNSTGRELDLPGDLKLSVFPWIALEFGPASLGNPPGFGAEPFATVRHAALRVKLLPLLRRRLQIGRIAIDGLDLRLHKNAAGKGNWQDFGGSSAAPESTSTETLQDVAGVVIKDSRVSYEDAIAEHVNLEMGHVASGSPVPVTLALNLTTGRAARPIELAGRFELLPDLVRKQYRLAPFELDATLNRKAGAAPLTWRFTASNLTVDLGAQTLTVPAFSSQLAAARVTGSVQGRGIVDAPSVTGSFRLDPVSIRGLMGELGLVPPETRDPKALTSLAASGDFAYGSNALRASKLDIRLDDSTLRGNAAITNLDTQALGFDLSLDRINVDRYRSPAKAAPATQSPPVAAKSGEPAGSAFKTLRMTGTLAIGDATIVGLDLTQVRVSVEAKDGVVRIAPLTARLYGGDGSADVTLDDRGTTPVLKLDQSLTGVDVAPLLRDFAKIQRISGRGTVTTNLTAHGVTSDEITRSLNGHVAADLSNGAVEGIDLWFEINRAVALIQKQALPPGNSSGRTRFDVFRASADVTNGVAATKDLSIASQNLRVTGQGTTNLVTDAINYQVKATVLKEAPTAKSASGQTLADIPLTITGTMTSPQVRPDLEAIARARLQQELGKHREELQQKLEDKLKDLLR